MENKKRYIWIVTESNTFDFADGNTKVNNSIRSYYSTDELARECVEFSKRCCVNNNGVAEWTYPYSAKYKLPNGENWVITCERVPIDA